MKALILASSLICVASLNSAWAQEPLATKTNPLQRQGELTCNDVVKSCRYVPVNAKASDIIVAINRTLLSGCNLFNSARGSLETASGGKSIEFWYNGGDPANETCATRDPAELFERLKAAVVYHDHFAPFGLSPMIRIVASVYTATSDSIREFQAQVDSLQFNPGGLGTIKSGTRDTKRPNGIDLGMNMGTAAFTAFVGGQIGKGNMSEVISITRTIPNNQSFSFTQGQKYQVGFTEAASVKEIQAGLSVHGDVFLNDRDEHAILIRNWSIDYSTRLPGKEVAIEGFQSSDNEFYLWAGKTTVLASDVRSKEARGTTAGVAAYGKSGSKEDSRMLVVISATPMSYEDYVAENEAVAGMPDTRVVAFSGEELARIQSRGPGASLEQVLASLDPYAESRAGETVLGFKLDKELASLSTYDREVTVKVEGAGPAYERDVEIQKIMLEGFNFKPIPATELLKPYLEIKVTIRPAKGTVGSGDRSFTFKRKLRYSTESNKLKLWK